MPILRHDGNEVDRRSQGAEDRKGDADGVSGDEAGAVFCEEGKGLWVISKASVPTAGAGLTAMIPPMLPKPICQPVPTDRRWCPPRFMVNQQTMIGMAL